MNTTTNRETWLNSLAAKMAPRFEELGHPLPKFRVAVGFTSTGIKGKGIGECWDKRASADRHFEIFIRPDLAESGAVAFALAHELTHAAVGLKAGHTGDFAKVALALGFPRPLTHAKPFVECPGLVEWLQPLLDELGPVPHAALSWKDAERGTGGMGGDDGEEGDGEGGDTPDSSGPKKQKGRLVKAACEACGYTVRVTAKWLEVGPPHCPTHGAMAIADAA
jgi:hypothetical protein